MLEGEIPEGFVFDDVEGDVPGFGTLFIEDLAMSDLEAVGGEIGLVVVHDLEFDEHAVLDGFDELASFGRSEIFFFEPVGEGDGAPGFQEFGGGGKETLFVVIVGDGFDGP